MEKESRGGFRELKVYQKAYEASLEIHHKSLTFPSYEQMELGGQIRRSSKSVVYNIVEGYGRNSTAAEMKRFLMMSRGSCDETRVQLEYCKDLGYITKEEQEVFEKRYIEIGKMLSSMIRNWQ